MTENIIKLEELTAQAMLLSPLDKIRLIERIMPKLEQELSTDESPQDTLSAWGLVYAGLSEKDIMEVEKHALDRSHFMKQEA